MVNNKEIRMAVRLTDEQEDAIFNTLEEADELFNQENNLLDCLNKIEQLWNDLPEPKFNTSCSDMLLQEYIRYLNLANRHLDAEKITSDWITDLESSGFKIYHYSAYILCAETLLYLDKIEEAKHLLQTIYKKYQLTARDFLGKHPLLFNITKGLVADNHEIATIFKQEIAYQIAKKENNLPQELAPEISEEIDKLSEQGNNWMDNNNFHQAIAVWLQALRLVPEPYSLYAEAQWLQVSIGDAYFSLNEYKMAQDYFEKARANIKNLAYENAFIMLRLGQIYFEMGDKQQASEYLLRAHLVDEQLDIFEDENPKYFNFLKTTVLDY